MPSPERLDADLAGRYAIEREAGSGGMATVYLARDLRHDRRVALKVLHPDLAAALGAERFLAEIRTTANLQHPHILPLHDSGDAGGALFYVMPFVEGETLRARLERDGPLPIDDALRLAREVLSALDYAHRKGIVHRDVKPENILLHDGSALVADFGIALAVQSAGGARMTQTGLSLGTPSYMSPEQAMGERQVDARADVYAAGAMLYEMLVGEPPFTGPSVQAIVAKVMTERPTPPSTVRDTVPAAVEAAVLRALAKLPADRFASAALFADALVAGAGQPAAGRAAAAPARSPSRAGRVAQAAPWLLAAALGAALVVALRRPAPAEPPVVRMRLDLPVGEEMVSAGFPIVLSPAGDRLAYVTNGVQGYRTFVRRTDELTGRQISPTTLAAMCFSPDGRWLAYEKDGEIRRVSSDGGAVTVVGSLPARAEGMTWAGDEIVVATPDGLWATPSGGGAPRRITPGVRTDSPVALPGGRAVVYRSAATSSGPGGLAVASLDGAAPVQLGITAADPLGMVDDHLVYETEAGALMAVPFDARGRRVVGDPVQVERGVSSAGLSASGTIAYMPGESRRRIVLAAPSREDETLTPEARNYSGPRFSPDGRRIAVAVVDSSGVFTRGDIWVYDIGARTMMRLTTDGVNGAPEWSPDGSRILYRTARDGAPNIRWQRADGGAPPESLYTPPMFANEALLSADARWLVYRTGPGTAAPRSIFAAPLAGGGSPVMLVGGPASHVMPRLSPDGRWLAYQSDESGRFEVYVRPFPAPGPRVQVSTDGGSQAIWSSTGGTLHYTSARGLMAATVARTPAFAVGDRRTVLAGDYLGDPTHQNYDVSPDGRTFVMLRPEGGRGGAVIVHGWARELRAKLAAAR